MNGFVFSSPEETGAGDTTCRCGSRAAATCTWVACPLWPPVFFLGSPCPACGCLRALPCTRVPACARGSVRAEPPCRVCVCVSVYPWVCTGVCSVGEQCTCVHVRVSVCREGNVCPRRAVCVRVYGGGKDPFTTPEGTAPPEHTRRSTEDPRTGGQPTAVAPNPRTRAPRGTCRLQTEHRQGGGLCAPLQTSRCRAESGTSQ